MTETPAATAPAASVTSSASVGYLDGVAATDVARAYKTGMLAALRIAPGHCVLDVGCGPGTDLAALADAVGPTGTVHAVDQDPAMVATARERFADHGARVRIHEADAQRLPFEDAGIDRARVDRVLMHVADPAAALGELRRVLRPGGLLALAEPDWDTLAVDHPDLECARAFTQYVARHTSRNQAIGRQLPRLAHQAGFAVESVGDAAPVLTDFATAESILGLRRNTARAVAAGLLTPAAGAAWLEHLIRGPFFATVGFITVLARRPA